MLISPEVKELVKAINASDPKLWRLGEYCYTYDGKQQYWVANGPWFVNLNHASVFGIFEKFYVWHALRKLGMRKAVGELSGRQ